MTRGVLPACAICGWNLATAFHDFTLSIASPKVARLSPGKATTAPHPTPSKNGCGHDIKQPNGEWQ